MRIVVAAVSSNLCMSGISRHASNLARCLLTRFEISGLHILVAEWEQKYINEAINRSDPRLHIHPIALRKGTLSRNLWYYRALPAIARQLRADIVHLAYPSPIQKGAFPCPVITTLHDLYPYDIPSNFGFPKVYFNRMILRQCLQSADAIACVSDSTRSQVRRNIPAALAKTVTVNNCTEAAPIAVKPAIAMRWSDQAFLLCVAQHRQNKNIPVALCAFERLLSSGAIAAGMHLLLVGMPGPETRRIGSLIQTLGIEKNVVQVSGISDAEMDWCYRNCEVLLAPSIIEGFGLPVAEGLQAGCRVVCSDIPAFREIGAGACSFVELGPDADKQFAKAILECLRKKRPLPFRLPNLSPTEIGVQYVKLYGAALSSWKSVRTPTNAEAAAIENTASESKGTNVPTRARL